ncbi:MAG: sulfatase-like hydrolase/transferase [Bacteroidales bacterium]
MPKSRLKYLSEIELNKNLYLLLVYRFLVVMALFSICRVAFYLINRGYFPNTTLPGMLRLMSGGLVFDTSAVLYTNLLYFIVFLLPFTYRYNQVVQTVMKYFFLVTNSLALSANCIDFIYFQFGFRRTTASIFSEFKHEDNLGALMPKFIVGYWYVVLIGLALIAVLYFSYGPSHISKTMRFKDKKTIIGRLVSGTILLGVFALLIIAGLRGDLKHSTRPITLSNAGKYISEPLEANIVLNTPFAIYRTISKQFLEKEGYYSNEDELDKIYTPVHKPVVTEPFKPENVVVLILESFGCEYTRSFGGYMENGTYQGFTPFLDSLIGNSTMYLESFSNGRKSIDAMPSVLASIPMMVEPFLLTPYSSNKINSIASILKNEGYYSAYFHGAPNGSMGFDAFAKSAGFEDYFGLNEYPNKKDFDGSWGVWDEEFFQFFANTMNGFRQPFCSAIFSVSSHHPFVVPERYKGKFKHGPMPIHQCINYTDFALRKFFHTASKMPWFNNTLFVITGDHTSQSVHLEYKTNLGAFRVPVIFFKPDGSLKKVVNGLAQQIDILPSVLGYLNYSKPYVAFGRNLLNPAEEPFVITYTTNTYQLVMGDYLYLFNGLTETGFYNYKKDVLLSKNITGQFPELETKMKGKVEAFIQQYNNRMIENRLTVTNDR